MRFEMPPRLSLARAAALFIAVAAPITVLVALVYASVQQNFRQNANDPQIAIAEDASTSLSAGRQPSDIVPKERVDIGKSLSPYVMVLNDSGDSLASSGELDGRVPRIPGGVLDHVRRTGETRVTWQPRRGVRSAIIVCRYRADQPGFVVAGRSLREVEIREAQLSQFAAAAWMAALFATAAACLIGCFFENAIARNAR